MDPPHLDGPDWCGNCHTTHHAPGGTLTTISGNVNLCQSCHVAGGQASARPLADADQALPWPGLPAGTAPRGTSHRWDSGVAGHVQFLGGATTNSTGTVLSGGVFTGAYAKTYTLTVTTPGNVGTARFNWTATSPGGGGATNVPTGTNVLLNEGIQVTFQNGSGVSFQSNDQWRIFVRSELRAPTNAAVLSRMDGSRLICSTCHDPHSQINPPFDPAAPPYGGPGTGAGRHFLRVANDTGQLCGDCHATRNVTSAAAGSHPVRVSIPTNGAFRLPANLPLDGTSGNMGCETCHALHFAATTNGTLLRLTNGTALCVECHTLADTVSPAAHFHSTNTATLWPGGQYGTLFPRRTDATDRGGCLNCHAPHGWPNATNTTDRYPALLVDQEESLCFTCHDADGPAARKLQAEFTKASAHPLALASRVHRAGEPALIVSRHVECADCHNPHQATARLSLPGPSTTPRPASGPLAGVAGVNAAGTAVNPAAFEYELCFRCHADSPNQPPPRTLRQFPQPNIRLQFSGSATSSHPVVVQGRNPYVPSLIGGWTTNSVMACTDCHNNNAGPNNGGVGPNGPHGSTWPALLERAYATVDGTAYAPWEYALCFKCHSVSSIMNNESFPYHRLHIERQATPCHICHDPHASAGQPRLINFRDDVVGPASNGRREFISRGRFRGECSLMCHDEDHRREDY